MVTLCNIKLFIFVHLLGEKLTVSHLGSQFFCFLFLAVLGLRCCPRAFSSCGKRGHSSLWCAGFSLWSLGSRHMGFSSCSTWAQQLRLVGCRVQAQQLWHTGLVAPRHVGSSQTRARTHVPCIGRQTPNHFATREAPVFIFNHHIFLLNTNAMFLSVFSIS